MGNSLASVSFSFYLISLIHCVQISTENCQETADGFSSLGFRARLLLNAGIIHSLGELELVNSLLQTSVSSPVK